MNSKVTSFKGVGEIKATAEAIRVTNCADRITKQEVIMNENHLWEVQLKETRIIETLDEHSVIKHTMFALLNV